MCESPYVEGNDSDWGTLDIHGYTTNASIEDSNDLLEFNPSIREGNCIGKTTTIDPVFGNEWVRSVAGVGRRRAE